MRHWLRKCRRGNRHGCRRRLNERKRSGCWPLSGDGDCCRRLPQQIPVDERVTPGQLISYLLLVLQHLLLIAREQLPPSFYRALSNSLPGQFVRPGKLSHNVTGPRVSVDTEPLCFLEAAGGHYKVQRATSGGADCYFCLLYTSPSPRDS